MRRFGFVVYSAEEGWLRMMHYGANNYGKQLCALAGAAVRVRPPWWVCRRRLIWSLNYDYNEPRS